MLLQNLGIIYVGEWKSIAEESKGRVAKYAEGTDQIYATLEEFKSELSCTEQHPESTCHQIGKYDTT